MKRLLLTLSQKWPELLLEGIVIVCSILLAIALENWNESQKELKLEAAFLSSVNVEFRKNQQQFTEVVGAHRMALNAIQNLVAEMQRDNPNPDSINYYSKGVWNHYTFNPSQTSIRAMTNSSVQIIKNEELRNLLLNWSDLLEDYTEEEISAKKNFEERIRPFLEKNFELKRWLVDVDTRNMVEASQIFFKYFQDPDKYEEIIQSAAMEDEKQKSITYANLKRVYEAGIIIALSTDAGNPGTLHGLSIYDELEAMQKAGIPAKNIIQMATKNGALAMRRANDFGTVEVGKLADLIVMEKDPSVDVTNFRSITHVMRGGLLRPVNVPFEK